MAIMESNITMEQGDHKTKEDRFLFLFTYDNPRGSMQGGLKYDLENEYIYQAVKSKIYEILKDEEKHYNLRIQRIQDKENKKKNLIEKIKLEYNLN